MVIYLIDAVQVSFALIQHPDDHCIRGTYQYQFVLQLLTLKILIVG